MGGRGQPDVRGCASGRVKAGAPPRAVLFPCPPASGTGPPEPLPAVGRGRGGNLADPGSPARLSMLIFGAARAAGAQEFPVMPPGEAAGPVAGLNGGGERRLFWGAKPSPSVRGGDAFLRRLALVVAELCWLLKFCCLVGLSAAALGGGKRERECVSFARRPLLLSPSCVSSYLPGPSCWAPRFWAGQAGRV